jgi:glycosyltransferase involved in cell wall biosynthesis
MTPTHAYASEAELDMSASTLAMGNKLGEVERSELMQGICVNARFRFQQTTGVQRYADAVLRRLPDGVEAMMPSRSFSRGVRGQIWEQFQLPARVEKRVLWSPCNTGPLEARRHVITIHDTAVFDCAQCYSRKYGSWHRWMTPRLVKRALKILTVSEFSKSRLLEHFGIPEDRVVVAGNGVDDRFQPASECEQERVRADYHLPRQFALTVGTLDPRKNLRGILAAWRMTPGLGELPLAVAGCQSAVFRSAVREPIPSSVHMLGYVPDDRLPALYSAASVFIFASLYEGFGLPPLEAMACGTPTVCSNTSALPEVVGKSALLVDPRDSRAIGEAVKTVVEDGALHERLSEAGRRRAKQFDWKETAARVWDVLRSAA